MISMSQGVPVGDEDLYRYLVESVSDTGIVALDTKGSIQCWNGGAVNITGFSEEDVLNRSLSDFVSLDNKELTFRTVLKSGKFEVEGWQNRKDETRYWARLTITA